MEGIEGQNSTEAMETNPKDGLENFLNDNPRLIGMVRSYAQFKRSTGKDKDEIIFEIQNEIRTQLNKLKKEHSQSVAIYGSSLVEVFDTHTGPGHNPFFDGKKAIRGSSFQMIFYHNADEVRKISTFFICELDQGISRTYFDSRGKAEKKEFVRNFRLRDIAEKEKEAAQSREHELKRPRIAGIPTNIWFDELRFNTLSLLGDLAKYYLLGSRSPKPPEPINENYGAFIFYDSKDERYKVEEFVSV